MIDHDAKPGPLLHCQICGSQRLRLIIDLGHQPPCDSLLSIDQLYEPEVTYPLRLNQCEECSLAQLDYVVPAEQVYPETYPYRAGISWPVVAAHEEMAANLVKRFDRGFCVDIGSNDGTLLQQLQRQGCEVMGVEPTGISNYAIAAGVPTVKEFFSEATATYKIDRQAHIITMTNVFAHMGDLGEVMRGIITLLAKDGVLVIENHYLLDILERNQFDSIYHEHVRTYTLKSLVNLFQQYEMEVFDVERVPRYGGNIRVFAARRGVQAIKPAVDQLLKYEEQAGVTSVTAWRAFRGRVNESRDAFMYFIRKHSTVGCSAPGRASTLLNYYGVTSEMMAWTGELEGSLKIGKFVPGCHIPIVSNRRIINEQPEYLVLLAWHYSEAIKTRLRKEGVQSKLLVPLPRFSEET